MTCDFVAVLGCLGGTRGPNRSGKARGRNRLRKFLAGGVPPKRSEKAVSGRRGHARGRRRGRFGGCRRHVAATVSRASRPNSLSSQLLSKEYYTRDLRRPDILLCHADRCLGCGIAHLKVHKACYDKLLQGPYGKAQTKGSQCSSRSWW